MLGFSFCFRSFSMPMHEYGCCTYAQMAYVQLHFFSIIYTLSILNQILLREGMRLFIPCYTEVLSAKYGFTLFQH